MKRTLTTLAIALFGAAAFAKGPHGVKPAACFVGGCSSQICSDDPNAMSTCMWKDEYICYSDATCERQKNGKCGWTQTKELKKCLKNPPQPEPELTPCYVSGCSGQICSEDVDVISTCEWRDEYMCYSSAVCERQKDGQCGWTSTPELDDCLTNPPQISEPEPLPDTDSCYITGCSGQVCSSEPSGMMTICDWREEYACYQVGKCERQKDEECGWTSTPELQDCLANAQSEPVIIEVLEPVKECFVGGCSGQLCTDDANIMSTCEWNESYACYAKATCERQGDGQCGWTSNPEFNDCLANPPSNAI